MDPTSPGPPVGDKLPDGYQHRASSSMHLPSGRTVRVTPLGSQAYIPYSTAARVARGVLGVFLGFFSVVFVIPLTFRSVRQNLSSLFHPFSITKGSKPSDEPDLERYQRRVLELLPQTGSQICLDVSSTKPKTHETEAQRLTDIQKNIYQIHKDTTRQVRLIINHVDMTSLIKKITPEQLTALSAGTLSKEELERLEFYQKLKAACGNDERKVAEILYQSHQGSVSIASNAMTDFFRMPEFAPDTAGPPLFLDPKKSEGDRIITLSIDTKTMQYHGTFYFKYKRDVEGLYEGISEDVKFDLKAELDLNLQTNLGRTTFTRISKVGST